MSGFLTPMEDIKLWQYCGMSGLCSNPCSTLPQTNSLMDGLDDDDDNEDGNLSRHSTLTPINQDDLPTDECDYDISPTQLYHCIETRRFELALTILRSATPEQKANQSPSGRKQANTWVYRKKPPIRHTSSNVENNNENNNNHNGDSSNNNNDYLWRHMPLHAAIIHSAPSSLISSLLKYSPPSAKCRDETGMLPLHFAFRKDDSPQTLIVEMLLAAYPDGASVVDDEGRLPHQCATSLTTSSTATTAAGGGVMMTGCVVPSIYCDLRSNGERRSAVEMMEAKLDRIKTDYEDRIAKSLKEHEAMQHDWNRTLTDCRTSHDEKMKQLHAENEALLTKQRTERDEKVNNLKELLEAANTEMERLRRLVQDSSDAVAIKMEEKQKEITCIQKERSKFEAQAQKLKDIIIRLEGSLSDSASANSTLQNRVALLTRELDDERRRLAIVTKEKEDAESKLIIEETERAEITKLVKEWKDAAKKREEEERVEAQRLAMVEKEMEGKKVNGAGGGGGGGSGDSAMVIGQDDIYGCGALFPMCIPFSQ